MLSRLADRFVLCPSREPVDPGGKSRRMIPFENGELEAWITNTRRADNDSTPDFFILKFSGNASRAERTTEHPAELWPDLNCEVWSINKPGYGGSTPPASLQRLTAAADAAYEAMASEAGGRPIMITGNSLGTAMALYLAARRQVAGLLLRNPVPLAEIIYERFGWWNLYLGSGLIARQVPADLDTIANAARTTAPALFLQSEADTLVPLAFQQRILDAYAGEKRVFVIAGAEHNTPLSDDHDLQAYQQCADWLRQATGIDGYRK